MQGREYGFLSEKRSRQQNYFDNFDNTLFHIKVKC